MHVGQSYLRLLHGTSYGLNLMSYYLINVALEMCNINTVQEENENKKAKPERQKASKIAYDLTHDSASVDNLILMLKT